jgi:hypothetical protein
LSLFQRSPPSDLPSPIFHLPSPISHIPIGSVSSPFQIGKLSVTRLTNHTYDPRSEPRSDSRTRTDPPHPLADQPKKPVKRPIKQRQSLAEKQPGTTLFPISRVKRIIKADKDLDMMTGEACFMISVATVSGHGLCDGTDGWSPGTGLGLGFVSLHSLFSLSPKGTGSTRCHPLPTSRQAGQTASNVF